MTLQDLPKKKVDGNRRQNQYQIRWIPPSVEDQGCRRDYTEMDINILEATGSKKCCQRNRQKGQKLEGTEDHVGCCGRKS